MFDKPLLFCWTICLFAFVGAVVMVSAILLASLIGLRRRRELVIQCVLLLGFAAAGIGYLAHIPWLAGVAFVLLSPLMTILIVAPLAFLWLTFRR